MNLILDACAFLAYLMDEPGSDVVESILVDESSACFALSLNLCEVYYQILRQSDDVTARQAVDDLLSDGIVEWSDMGRLFWEVVASHKARGRISLADCFCIALAQELSGQVVTSDHREFDPLVPLGICPIMFIR